MLSGTLVPAQSSPYALYGRVEDVVERLDRTGMLPQDLKAALLVRGALGAFNSMVQDVVVEEWCEAFSSVLLGISHSTNGWAHQKSCGMSSHAQSGRQRTR